RLLSLPPDHDAGEGGVRPQEVGGPAVLDPAGGHPFQLLVLLPAARPEELIGGQTGRVLGQDLAQAPRDWQRGRLAVLREQARQGDEGEVLREVLATGGGTLACPEVGTG